MTQKGFSIFELLRQSSANTAPTANPKLAPGGGEEHEQRGFVDGQARLQQQEQKGTWDYCQTAGLIL